MTRKNRLRKGLMYLVVLVGVLFVGFLAFYFSVNNETIALTIKEGGSVYLNEDDIIILPLEHKEPHRGTKITVESSNPDVAQYVESTNTIVANSGGAASFTITTTNKNFGPFKFDVLVGDGSLDNPWYVSTALQLTKIGRTNLEGNQWTAYNSYELLNDINLIDTFEPISTFFGTFSGEGHTISNIRINSSASSVGLFGTLASGAKFENVTLSNVNITATNATSVGMVAGINSGFIGKVKINGTINSSNPNAYVGGIAGRNVFADSRATISTVMATVNINANGMIGAVSGQNIGGIIFNVVADIKSLDANVAEESTQPLNSQYAGETPTVNYGGVVGHNAAVIYGTDNIFRQAAIKNVVARTNASALLGRQETYIANIGLVAYENVEITEHTYAVENLFENVMVQSINDAGLFVVANGAIIDSITQLTVAEFTNPATYASMSGVWSFDSNYRIPKLNLGISYENSKISDPGAKITDAQAFINAIAAISNNLNKEVTYTVDASGAQNHEFIIDASDIMTARGITSWVPIGTRQAPYKGKLIVENGYVVIKNLNIVSDLFDVGFFGAISGDNTEISNFKFQDVSITVSSAKANAGVLAGSIGSGYISNILIDNATILNAYNTGFLAGNIMNSVVENVSVGENFTQEHINLIKNTTANDIIYGGIAGTVTGTLKNVQVNNANIEQLNETKSIIGGIVGKLSDKGIIQNGYNNSLTIEDHGTSGYYGGVVGFMLLDTTVDSSYNLGIVENIIGTEEQSYAGGVAGYVGSSASIKKSFSNAVLIKNKNVGGIAGVNHGYITESYSLGEYTGQNVGGLAYLNAGTIIHCYTGASLTSIGNKDTFSVAGLVVKLPEKGRIQYVLSYASLQASNGAYKYAETSAPFRFSPYELGVNKLLNQLQTPGKITNYIVVNYGDAYVQTSIFGFGNLPPSFIKTDAESVKGLGITDPLTQAGFVNFAPHIWKIVEGEWPTLTDVVVADVED